MIGQFSLVDFHHRKVHAAFLEVANCVAAEEAHATLLRLLVAVAATTLVEGLDERLEIGGQRLKAEAKA